MVDTKIAIRRIREFGGFRLAYSYLRMGILWTGIRALWKCGRERRSFKTAYPNIIAKVEKVLISQYGHILDNALKEWDGSVKTDGSVPKIIWTGWMQGMDNAPYIVKFCIESQKRAFPEYEHNILTSDNYHQWVTLPDYVERKYRKGRIPQALFSDLLRLSVLKKYGGVWMDASILCTGFGNDKLRRRWKRIEDYDFTIYRYFQRGRKEAVSLSNWFIAAKKDNFVVSTLLDMLLAYWKDYDCTVDYYIMHLFISLVFSKAPAVAEVMPRENSYHSIMLGSVFVKDYNQEWWDDVKAHVFLHKLTYRRMERFTENPNSFYNVIFSKGSDTLDTIVPLRS